MDATNILRIINAILVVIGIGLYTIAYKRSKTISLLAPLTWLLDVAVFYIYRALSLFSIIPVEVDLLNLWGLILQLHGIILLIFSLQLNSTKYTKKEIEEVEK